MSKPFDPIKPVQTRDGRQARIICLDYNGHQPIIALVQDGPGGRDLLHYFSANGQFYTESERQDRFDLVNVPEEHTREVWINFYSDGEVVAVPTKWRADVASNGRIACVRVALTFTEGEGL